MFPIFDLVMSVLMLLFFAWTFYNIPAFMMGLHSLRKKQQRVNIDDGKLKELPTFSVIVPMKDEVKVARRIIESLLKLRYPEQKVEIFLVVDGSTDGTAAICRQFAEDHPQRITYLHERTTKGKPAALNLAYRSAKGEIVGVFDADNIPESDILLKASEHFKDLEVSAVQGMTYSLNADQNMLTKMVHYESLLQYMVFLQGKDSLGLFVPLAGTCVFIRREALEAVGGWCESSLSEDLDLSARLMEKGYLTKFTPDIYTRQENPSTFKTLINQRLRWLRGCVEVGLHYGRLLRHVNLKTIDAEVFFLTPILLALSAALGYLFGVYSFFAPKSLGILPITLAQITSLFMWTLLLLAGVGLVYVQKPRKLGNIKWLPFIYLYWTIQLLASIYAIGQIVLRRPRKWRKTPRSGLITDAIP